MAFTVFVSNDHALVCEGLVFLLAAQRGIEVVGAAPSGRDALNEVLRLSPVRPEIFE